MFAAVGAKALTCKEVLGGFVGRVQGVAKGAQTAAAAAHNVEKEVAAQARAILSQEIPDSELSSEQLGRLIRWKLAARGGSSKFVSKGDRQAKWATLKGGAEPQEGGVGEEDEQLPFEGELDFFYDEQQAAAAAPIAAATADVG